MATYWLTTGKASPSIASNDSHHTLSVSGADDHYRLSSNKTQRLIDWNVDVLQGLLKAIVARREASTVKKGKKSTVVNENIFQPADGETVLDEVSEIIELPEFNVAKKQEDPESVVLPREVVMQLQDFVTCIADLYHENVSK